MFPCRTPLFWICSWQYITSESTRSFPFGAHGGVFPSSALKMFHLSNLILYTQMSKKSLIFVGNTFISLVTSVIISEPVVNAVDSVNFCLENGKASTIRTIFLASKASCSCFTSWCQRNWRLEFPTLGTQGLTFTISMGFFLWNLRQHRQPRVHSLTQIYSFSVGKESGRMWGTREKPPKVLQKN